jgi:hypothetical protein
MLSIYIPGLSILKVSDLGTIKLLYENEKIFGKYDEVSLNFVLKLLNDINNHFPIVSLKLDKLYKLIVLL